MPLSKLNEEWEAFSCCEGDLKLVLRSMKLLEEKLRTVEQKLDNVSRSLDQFNQTVSGMEKRVSDRHEEFTGGILRDMEGRLIEETERKLNKAIRLYHFTRNPIPFVPYSRMMMGTTFDGVGSTISP